MRRKDMMALAEEKIWDVVAEEIDSGVMSKGLWLKALTETNNDKNSAKTC